MDEEFEVKIDPNVCCNVCGERSFNLREGFFYCRECGTKQEQMRDFEVEHEQEFAGDNSKRRAKKQKIKVIKLEKPELTSWECYNYILRGLVEELLSFGAKEELKLMALQIWTAYLRRMEVAFFNKKHAELPKLGARFIKRDAKTLYNQQQQQRAKRKRRNTNDTSGDESSARNWRKSKRNLDASTYSANASSANTSAMSQSSAGNTSSTGRTVGAIQLKFSTHARKRLKRIMPPKHLEKHEKDAALTCHKIRPLVRSLNRVEHVVHTMTMKQIYAILGIALNIIEDEIQLSDLVRFIREDHIGTKNVLQYFPENIAKHGEELLHEIDFYKFPHKYNDKILRTHCGNLVRFIHINKFQQPDIPTLILRYITDLELPPAVATFASRLANLMPPQFKTRAPHVYPAYEARAMAYVLFVMKLLFGLDGHKEKLISKAAQKLNKRVERLNKDTDTAEQHEPLFVWSDWMDYIEMRKIIVSQYSSAFRYQFKQSQSMAQVLEELAEDQRRENEEKTGEIPSNNKAANMKRTFEYFHETYAAKTTEQPTVEKLDFPPSFTPALVYFKRILLHCDNAPDKADGQIPDFMRVCHATHTVQPFLESQKLRAFLSKHDCPLKVLPTACSKKRCNVGVFRTNGEVAGPGAGKLRAYRADFQISDALWLERMGGEPPSDELEFKTELDSYQRDYQKALEAKALKRKQIESDNVSWPVRNEVAAGRNELQKRDAGAGAATEKISEEIPIEHFLMPSALFREKLCANRKREHLPKLDILSMHSIDVFSECNMDPIDNFNLNGPRRQLDRVNLFAGISDDEADISNGGGESSKPPPSSNCDGDDQALKREILTSDDEDDDEADANATLVTSTMDCWMLLGSFPSLTTVQKKILENKFSRSFFWLLETCAQTIGVDWSVLYEQLLAIELMFVYGIESLDDFRDCIYFRYNNPIKDFNMLINSYREIW